MFAQPKSPPGRRSIGDYRWPRAKESVAEVLDEFYSQRDVSLQAHGWRSSSSGRAIGYQVRGLGSNTSPDQVKFSLLPCVHPALNGKLRLLKIRRKCQFSSESAVQSVNDLVGHCGHCNFSSYTRAAPPLPLAGKCST
ncbi:hypothetical protein PoB_005978200 [Plakobranchus ocellatus]|uniref:Uncharacterized protein n=1 Tax=Plakobranchus ocellatus TaxID=259542 RepID=A0AAV4CN16_9GAST|nr:hypothetical protein PoB_005978200 [Plakobranchus ocellatus]